MALDYGMPDNGFTVEITTWKEEIPDDYSGVPKKSKTVEEVELAELMPGPAPLMMDPNMAPAPPPMMGGMPQMPQMAQMPQPQQQMPGSMGVQAAQSVMQQPFG
jgi:hypothetical protein